MSESFVLRLLFTRSVGSCRNLQSTPGSLDCFIWFSAAALSTFVAAGTVVEWRDGTLKARQLEPSEVDVRTLRALAERAGVVARDCRVAARIDTSDLWSHNLLRIDLNGKTTTLDLQLMATGFEGADAAALRALFGHLLGLAGIVEESVRNDLAR